LFFKIDYIYQKGDSNPYSIKELEPKPSMSTNSIILALKITRYRT
jgi:hypothetical protein